MDWKEIFKNDGINLNDFKETIKDVPLYSTAFIPYESLFVLVEPDMISQTTNYLFFLDLSCVHYYKSYGIHGQVEVYKKSEDEFQLIEPIVDINNIFLSQKKELSAEYINKIISSLDRSNRIQIPVPHGEDAIKERNSIYDKFLSKRFSYLWGTRELKDYEKAKIILSTGHFEPKKVAGVNAIEIINGLKGKLALQDATINELFNNINFHNILVGKIPKNSGIVLYGPGGTGKTTIMKAIVEIFENFGAYVALNEENEFLKTSEVKDTKYYGAYQDYFGPKFAEAIREARRRGIPSLIPIDEGDIFVENPQVTKNSHGPDVINFFKGHVGNHLEFIVILATNVLKENLDPIATRMGRIATVEIPLPDIPIVKKLILMFMNLEKIKLDRELSDNELSHLAQFVVSNKLPGSNISHFCKNFYQTDMDIEELYRRFGGDAEKVEEELERNRNQVIKAENFIQRFINEIGGNSNNAGSNQNSGTNGNEGNSNSEDFSNRNSSDSGFNSGGNSKFSADPSFFNLRTKVPTNKSSGKNYSDQAIQDLEKIFIDLNNFFLKIYNGLIEKNNNSQKKENFFKDFFFRRSFEKVKDYLNFIKKNIRKYDDMHNNLYDENFYENLEKYFLIFETNINSAFINNNLKSNPEFFIDEFKIILEFLSNVIDLEKVQDSPEKEIESLKNDVDIMRILNANGLISQILNYGQLEVNQENIKREIRKLQGTFKASISASYIYKDKEYNSDEAKIFLRNIGILINGVNDLYKVGLGKNKRIFGKNYQYDTWEEFLDIKIIYNS